jgi:hypothetical protein
MSRKPVGDHAMTNAERQRAWRERRRDARDEAIWQAWCARVGHDPNYRELHALVTAESQERLIKSCLGRVRRAVQEAVNYGATPEEIADAVYSISDQR